MFRYRHLFFMPSFYLLLTFSSAYCLYLTDIINWERPPLELHYWCVVTIILSAISVVYHSGMFNAMINSSSLQKQTKTTFLTGPAAWMVMLGFGAIGIAGVLKYLIDYSNYLGEFGILYSFFMEDTGQLRSMADNVESVGTQLSYFSWISAFIITAEVGRRKLSKFWLGGVFIIVLMNSLFLDRTRPVWLLFICILIYFITTYELHTRKKIVTIISGAVGFIVGFFLLVGSLLGKDAGIERYSKSGLPDSIQLLLVYVTSSFAYMGRLFFMGMPTEYYPARVTYPLQKLLAKFHLVEQPPNQVLEFFSVPFFTNVGSFMEPYFQDGGRIFLLMGILLHTFVFDRIVYYFLRKMNSLSVIIIAAICYINFIAFFVPKIASTATWFIMLSVLLIGWLLPTGEKNNDQTERLLSGEKTEE